MFIISQKNSEKGGQSLSRRTRRRKDIHLEPFSKRRLEVPSCAGALASPSTRRGSSSPSAPSRRAWGGRLPAPFATPQAAAPRSTSQPSPCRLSEPWRKWWRRSTALVVLVAMGGGALLSFRFGKTRERRRFPRLKQQPVNGRTTPVSPAYKEGGVDVPPFRIKKPPTISPTTPHSTRAVRGGAWIRGEIRRNPGRACPCPVLGLAQQRSAPCMAQARGLLSVY